MKQLITATIAFLLITVAANAQKRKCGNETNGNHKGNHKKEMAEKLQITDAQKTKIKTIKEQTKKDKTALEANNSMTLGDYKAKKATLEQNKATAIKNVYTPEQTKQLETLKADKKAKHEAKQQQKFAALQQKANLTPTQVSMYTKNKENASVAIGKIKQNTTLTKAEKHQQIKAVKQENKQSFLSSLTPEQKLQVETMKKEKGKRKPVSK